MAQHFFPGLRTKQAAVLSDEGSLGCEHSGMLPGVLPRPLSALAFKTRLPRLAHRALLRLGHLLALSQAPCVLSSFGTFMWCLALPCFINCPPCQYISMVSPSPRVWLAFHSSLYSLNKCLLSSCHRWDTVLGQGWALEMQL